MTLDIAALYRAHSRGVLATLIRLLRDFDLAEDALHDAFVAAAEQWPRVGVPDKVGPWLVSTGRFCALARLRRLARFDRILARAELQKVSEVEASAEADLSTSTLTHDRLRLIFTCCHPSLGRDAQLALTLREVCGLRTEEIASLFLAKPSAIAQRIVRTKRRITDERIPYEVPPAAELPARLESVLNVIYLVFSEGYAASSGARLAREDLCTDAIELCRSLAEALPEPDVLGLLALLLLQDSRREARTSASGDLVLLAEQDRSRWNRAQIREAGSWLAQALQRPPHSAYTLAAAIAAVHAEAAHAEATDWKRIVQLYDLLCVADPSPVVALNRAVSVGELDGPETALGLIDALMEQGALDHYRYAHSARAEFARRAGRLAEARQSYLRALELTRQEPERRFLERRLRELSDVRAMSC